MEEKRRKLKEDKDNCDLAYGKCELVATYIGGYLLFSNKYITQIDVVMESQARLNKRNLRKRGLDNADNKGNKRKQLTGPALVFKLRDEDILYDIQAMKHVSSCLFFIVSGEREKGTDLFFSFYIRD